MYDKWFSNRGQVVQIALAFIALVVGIIVAIPSFKEHKELLVNWAPYVFLILLCYSFFQAGRLSRASAPPLLGPVAQANEVRLAIGTLRVIDRDKL